MAIETCRPKDRFAPCAENSAPSTRWSCTEKRRQACFPLCKFLGASQHGPHVCKLMMTTPPNTQPFLTFWILLENPSGVGPIVLSIQPGMWHPLKHHYSSDTNSSAGQTSAATFTQLTLQGLKMSKGSIVASEIPQLILMRYSPKSTMSFFSL